MRILHIDKCRRINLIVGDNGSGKTALLEAIFTALGASTELAVRFRQQRGLEGQFTGPARRIEEALWRDLFFKGNWEHPISVSLEGDGPESRSVTVFRGQSQLTIPLTKEDGVEAESRTAPQASPHFFRRDFNKLEIGQSVGRSIVVAPRGWPSFSFPRFRAGGNERRVNIRLLQMLMVHVGVKNEGIREVPSISHYSQVEHREAT